MKLNLTSSQSAVARSRAPAARGVKLAPARRNVSVSALPPAESEANDALAETISRKVKPMLVSDLLNVPKLKRRGLMMAGAAAMFGCECCSDMLGTGAAQANASWTYKEDGFSGPDFWPDQCLTGGAQSPIDLSLANNRPQAGRGTIKFPVGPLQFDYGRYEKVNFQPGNMVTVPKRYVPVRPPSQLLASSPGGACLCPTKPFDLDLIQYHFHTPSEHAIDGKQAAMEAHLVHRNKNTGGLAVVAVLIQPGGPQPNPCLELGLEEAPTEGGVQQASTKTVNPAMLLPRATSQGTQPYVHYTGSLTTPPCSEGVDWFVLTTPIKVPDKQVLDFMRFAGNGKGYVRNSRPLQPINGREIDYSDQFQI
eukprot:gene25992-11682_t